MHDPSQWPEGRTRLHRITKLAGLVALTLLFTGSLLLVFLNNRFTPSWAAGRAARLTNPPASTAVVKGFELWYRMSGADRGNTPVVVLLGEAGQSGSAFAEHFRFLERDRRVILYDPRGCGNSQSKSELSSYTVANLVAELDKRCARGISFDPLPDFVVGSIRRRRSRFVTLHLRDGAPQFYPNHHFPHWSS